MIVPISNGRTITPIYIPSVVLTNAGKLQQSDNTQNNESTLASWIILGVVLIFLIVLVAYFIKLVKDFFGGEE